MMRRRSLLAASLLPSLATETNAQGARPIRIVVAAAPGGGNDIFARLYAPHLSRLLGASVIVENRAGANGQIGADHVARSAPDGNTLLYAASNIAIAPSLAPSASFDLLRDLLPVSLVLSQPFIVVTSSSLGVRSIGELLMLARRRSSPIAYGVVGSGGATGLIPQALFRRAGVSAIEVPYRGTGPLSVALLSGEVQMGCLVYPVARPSLEDGKLTALAVTGTAPMRKLPEVPTLVASGFPTLTAGQWHGMLLPAGTPQPIVERLSRAIAETVLAPEVNERLESEGASAVGSTPAEFTTFLRAELLHWSDMARAAAPSD